jgi:hypothetical protein
LRLSGFGRKKEKKKGGGKETTKGPEATVPRLESDRHNVMFKDQNICCDLSRQE